MAITVQVLRRLEIWNNWACNAGARTAVLQNISVLQATSNVQGSDKLTIVVPANSPEAILLAGRRIIRIDEDDTPSYDEWKIVDWGIDTSSNLFSAMCSPFGATELLDIQPCYQLLSDGSRNYDFQVVGQTPSQIISNYILPVCPSYIALGTVSPTAPVDFAFQWDSPLSALQRLAKIASPEQELNIRRNSITNYLIDIVPQINSSAAMSDVRARKNLKDWRQQYTTVDQVTRVFPRGADMGDNIRGSMARAAWLVTVVAGGVISLADPAGGDGPILADGQLVGAYLRRVDGALVAVTASAVAGQTVTLGSGTGVAVNDLVQFRADSSGNDLTWLDSPADIASSISGGVKTAVLDVPDIPAVLNVVKNSVMRAYAGAGVADNWTLVGTPTVTKTTSGVFTKIGGASTRVQSTLDGNGVRTPMQPLGQSQQNPYASGFGKIYVASGSVRVQIVATIGGSPVIWPTAPLVVANNSSVGQFIDLGVTGYDAQAAGATAIGLQVVQNGIGAADFYVDAAQVTNTSTQQPFVEGSGGTKLWQAANNRLRVNGGPVVSYDMSLLDLARISPATWAVDSSLIVGGNVRVNDPAFSLAIQTRLIEVSRNYLMPGDSRVVLSNQPTDLVGTGARPRRGERFPGAPTAQVPQTLVLPEFSFDPSESADGKTGTATVTPRGDIQARVQSVDFSATNGRGTVTTGTVASPGPYTFTADLTYSTKTPSKIKATAKGYDLNGVANQVLWSDTLTFGVGSKPFVTNVGYSIAGGTPVMSVNFGGDSDTDSAFVLVREWSGQNAPPMTVPDILTLGTRSATGARVGAVSGVGPRAGGIVAPHTKFTIGIVAANAGYLSTDIGTYSDLFTIVDTWTGIGAVPDSIPTLRNFVQYDTKVTAELVFDLLTQGVEVYLVEYPTDPAASSPINSAAAPPPPSVEGDAPEVFNWYNVKESSIAGDGALVIGITFPIRKPSNYAIVTVVGFDALNQRLPGSSSYKLRASGTPPTLPNAPTIAATGTVTSNQIPVSVTTSATGAAPTKLRPYINGVQQADVTVAVAQGSAQTVNIAAVPNTAYSIQFSIITATGLESSRSNTYSVSTPTGQIPTPVIDTDASFAPPDEVSFIVYPAGGTPAGVVWHVERGGIAGGAKTEQTALATSSTYIVDSVLQSVTVTKHYYYKVWGVASGWADSARSGECHATIPPGRLL